MDDFQKNILTIIQSALTEEKGELSDSFNLEKSIKLAKKHSIVSIFYLGAVLCGIPADNPLMTGLLDDVCKSVAVDMRQVSMIEVITRAFDNAHIDYMPLKGILLKPLYPKTEMRAMSDADILIKLEHYPQIEEILKQHNFVFKYESDHELVWSNASLILELHKSIMTSYNKDFYRYFQSGWALAKKVEGTNSRYELTTEDFYVYMFVHFTKHYRISGIGIKHILDLWIYSNKHPELDWDYIYNVLEQLRLYEFHQNVTDTLEVWFNNKIPTGRSKLITDVIFSSGQYGTPEMTNINRTIRESVNNGTNSVRKTVFKQVFRAVFPTYKDMKKDYSVLKKLPFILPFMWIYRWGELLIFKRKDIRRYLRNLKAFKRSSVEKSINSLQYVGLDFTTKE